MSAAAVRSSAAAVPGGGAVVPFPVESAAACPVPVMLSIKDTAERFGLPVHMIRQAVASGAVYSVRSGSKKFWVNQDSVVRWLSGEVVSNG